MMSFIGLPLVSGGLGSSRAPVVTLPALRIARPWITRPWIARPWIARPRIALPVRAPPPCDLGGQGIQALVPEPPEALQPLVDLPQRGGLHRVQPAGALRPDGREPAVPEYPQV